MHDFLVAAVAFVVLVGLMVVVHEFGHFAVAKAFGVRVESFSVGFGPRLFGVKYGDTDYKVCLLPLGGFVKMTGETPDTISGPGEERTNIAEDPGAFTSHPRWQRMLIGLAGPVSNFILAFVLMLVYFAWLNEVPDVHPATVEWVTPGSDADHAGLRPGDSFQSVAGVANPDLDSVVTQFKDHQGKTIPVTVERAGQPVQLSLHVTDGLKARSYDLSPAGVFLTYETNPITVDQVMSGTPAEQAGLKAGDQIVGVDGHSFHTLDPMLDYLQWGQGKPVALSLVRNGAPLSLVVHPAEHDSEWRIGFSSEIPADPPIRREPMSFADAVQTSADFCATNSLLIVHTLQNIAVRKVSVKQLSGPVGIAQMAGKAAEMNGWLPKFGLAAAISLNLGILNLLPFPILDGGLILFLLIESFMRRDISIMVKERIYQAAFVLIMVFTVFVIFNDVTKLPFFSHLKP